jgi:hypothetical protein
VKLFLSLLVLLSGPGAIVVGQQTSQDSSAASWQYRFSGYYKSLLTASRSFFTRDSYGDSLNRLRLSFDARRGRWFQTHIDFDNEAHFGNRIRLPDFELVRGRQDTAYVDLQHVYADKRHVYWDTSLYRAFVNLRHESAALTVGRQRIGWGTARFWSPADVFNPLNPLQIEWQEREGVDAAQLELTLPRESAWTLVYAPQDGFRHSRSATRLSTNLHNYDVAVFAGRFGGDWMGGGEFAGQWGGAGLRGEITYTWRKQRPEHNALRFAVGSDYAFANTLYLVGEYFYNQGQPQDLSGEDGFDPTVFLRPANEIFTLKRHFLSGGIGYDVTPLFRLETYSVLDVEGPSAFFMPLARYNLTTNTDIVVGGQLLASSETGEFQGISNLFYLELRLHF